MKIGFIGFGKSVHRYHAPFLEQLENVEVIGYHSRSRSKFDMEHPSLKNTKYFKSIGDLFNSEVELVVISTPSATHYEFAKASIKAGKHVLIEKPMCDTLAQAIELYDLAEEYNVKISPYQNRRYDSDFLDVVKVLKESNLGSVMEIESNHTQYRDDGLNTQSNKYNGFIYGHAVHFLDQIICLFGIPSEMMYDTTNQRDYYLNGSGDIDDYYDIKLIYGNMRVRVRFSQLIVKNPPRWIINGTNATVEKYDVDQQERDLKKGIYPTKDGFGKDQESSIMHVYYKDGSTEAIVQDEKILYTQFYRDLISSIENDSELPVKRKQALCVIDLLETIVDGREYVKRKY